MYCDVLDFSSVVYHGWGRVLCEDYVVCYEFAYLRNGEPKCLFLLDCEGCCEVQFVEDEVYSLLQKAAGTDKGALRFYTTKQ
jgi:hypothetical protein